MRRDVLVRIAAAGILAGVLFVVPGIRNAVAQFELDCASAQWFQKCRNLPGGGCGAAPSAGQGCVASGSACENCYQALTGGGGSLSLTEQTQETVKNRALWTTARPLLVISEPGPLEQYGLRKGDLLSHINSVGIEGTFMDLQRIGESRKAGAVTLKVWRITQIGEWESRLIEVPALK